MILLSPEAGCGGASGLTGDFYPAIQPGIGFTRCGPLSAVHVLLLDGVYSTTKLFFTFVLSHNAHNTL